jgi:small subunit ribosomal protein S20
MPMPHTKSAKKSLRKDAKRRLHNRSIKKSLKLQLRGFTEAVAEGPVEKLREEYNKAAKKLDKAASRRVLHPNTAARKKSQLARAVNKKAAAASK